VSAAPDTYRGWRIAEHFYCGWQATHPDFDPTPVYADDGPSDFRYVFAGSLNELHHAINEWIEEDAKREAQEYRAESRRDAAMLREWRGA
jgi:hypothetical protein